MENQIKVKKHLITYLDILGYKQLIYGFKNEDMFLVFLDEALKAAFTVANIEKRKFEIKTNIFSDNIILAIEINSEDKNETIGVFKCMFEYLSIFQATLISHYTIYVRGGMTIGPLYMDKKLGYVFGTGLIDAYNKENKEAKYPRILVDNSILEIASGSKMITYIYKDTDDKYIFNYLGYYAYMLFGHQWNDEVSPIVLQEIFAHKKAILQSIKTFGYDEKLMEKYNWVVKYHNGFCCRYKLYNFKIEKNEIIIDEYKKQN